MNAKLPLKDELKTEIINDIMDSFDFRYVSDIIKQFEMGLYDCDSNSIFIPDEYEIRKFVRRNLRKCADEEITIITGRFEFCYYSGIEDGIPWLKINLKFVPVESTNYDGKYYINF